MYAFIKGTIAEKREESLVIEAGGIGYEVFVPVSAIEKCGSVNEKIKVLTYLHVREDIFCLYGFLTFEEQKLFRMLVSISGIGPKAALAVISCMPPSAFCLAVISGDVRSITAAQGIGKKTAQRIILELKDKLKKENIEIMDSEDEKSLRYDGSKMTEALGALVLLGYTQKEAQQAVSKVYSDEFTIEEILTKALKMLGKA